MTHPVLFGLRLLAVVICHLCTLLIDHDPLLDRSHSTQVIGRQPPAFAQSYAYADGLEVKITESWVGRRLFVPVAEFTVVVRNGSGHTFEAWQIGALSYGPRRHSALRCPVSPGPGDPGSVQLIAIGESSYPYRLCFVLPDTSRDDIVFELRIDAGGHEPSVFAGRL